MWMKYRLKVLLLLQLAVVLSSAENYSLIEKSTSSVPGSGGCFYHYVIKVQNRTELVCPVTNLAPTALQPSTTPRVNGSFYVDWLESAAETFFDLQFVVEGCCPDSTVSVVAASDSRCDKLFIIRSGSIDRRGSFFIRYISSGGAVIITEILFGPDGVSLIRPLPENGSPLLINARTSLLYELRIPTVDGQSLSPPILCERMLNGDFKHTMAFQVRPNSQTPGCVSSSSMHNGYSTPYITEVAPDNLSLLFSDPTAIYLTYGGTCNSSVTSLSSAVTNITITGSSVPPTTPSSTMTTQDNDTIKTTPTNSTVPPTSAIVSTESTGQLAEPTTADLSTPTNTNDDDDDDMTTVNAVVESTEVTQVTGHPGSTHIATSVNSNPLHSANIWISLICASVVVTSVLVVSLVFACIWKWRRKSKDVENPGGVGSRTPVELTGMNYCLDTDSGVGSANGGTPMSDGSFTLNEQGCCTTPSGDKRVSELTDCSLTAQQVQDISKAVKETKNMIEDLRDNIYTTQIGDNSDHHNEEAAG